MAAAPVLLRSPQKIRPYSAAGSHDPAQSHGRDCNPSWAALSPSAKKRTERTLLPPLACPAASSAKTIAGRPRLVETLQVNYPSEEHSPEVRLAKICVNGQFFVFFSRTGSSPKRRNLCGCGGNQTRSRGQCQGSVQEGPHRAASGIFSRTRRCRAPMRLLPPISSGMHSVPTFTAQANRAERAPTLRR